MRTTRSRGAIALLSLALLATACGGDDPEPAVDPAATGTAAPTTGATDGATDTGSFPVTITADNGEITIEQRPDAIVSISPTSTEVLFAIGAGGQVVAVDDQSNFPADAPTTDLSSFEPNVEAISAFEPDLVVLSFDPGDVIAGLESLGITVIHHNAAADLDTAYAQIEQLGAATGSLAGAADVVAQMQQDIAAIADSLPDSAEGLTYYHELDPSYFTATSSTFIGDVYSRLGLVNIADTAEGAETGFPQLSAEFIVEADPDLIFLADTRCCGESAETVAQRPGWDQIGAVQTGAVVELDDDIASRWGPRIVEYLRTVGEAISQLEPAA